MHLDRPGPLIFATASILTENRDKICKRIFLGKGSFVSLIRKAETGSTFPFVLLSTNLKIKEQNVSQGKETNTERKKI